MGSHPLVKNRWPVVFVTETNSVVLGKSWKNTTSNTAVVTTKTSHRNGGSSTSCFHYTYITSKILAELLVQSIVQCDIVRLLWHLYLGVLKFPLYNVYMGMKNLQKNFFYVKNINCIICQFKIYMLDYINVAKNWLAAK